MVGQRIGSRAAAEEWGRQVPRVDHECLELVDDLRSRGYVVAVLTNGTDTVSEEMRMLALAGHFDVIFNSAVIGHVKPDVHVYTHVLTALALDGGEVFFTDDSASNVEAATHSGIVAHHFRAVPPLRQALCAAGIDAG